ncbi:MAG TPA: PEGA domain-containing protein [Spirochaetia bacterium]|nr:PEGA domain-containing protein [Spirochaetia bacterium]
MRSITRWAAPLILLAAGTSLFAQGLGIKRVWNLIIQVDVPGATILVDNKPIPGNATRVPESIHNVKVQAPGYAPFSIDVNVNRDTTLPVHLQSVSFPLSLSTNVPGAQVWLDGILMTGPPVAAWGTHTVKVSAPGYQDYNASFTVNGPTALQVTLVPMGILLTVNANVGGATVLVNNVAKGGLPYTEYLPPGTYAVRVQAPGYSDFMTSVALNQPITVNAMLQPQLFPVTLNLNVQSPIVMIDGVRMPVTPNVSMGQHTLQISAQGYMDYTGSFTVTGPTVLQIALNPQALQLSVNANVDGAQVMVNNVSKGPAPYAESLPIGTYAVRVFADGYLDYQANVSLTQPVALNVQLQPKPVVPATMAVVIPRPFVDSDIRPGDPQSTIRIWVDDKLVNPKRELAGIQIPPGKHRVRIGSGALMVQLGDYVFQPGINYTLELGLTAVVKTPTAQQ